MAAVSLALASSVGAWLSSPASAQGVDAPAAQTESRTFPETGKTIAGKFLQYWQAHGGLAQQGYPISAEIKEQSDTDGKTYTVQYFERAVFEMHPENKAPNDVLLALLGSFLYKQKYPTGAPSQTVNAENARKYPQTGHSIGGVFLKYWDEHGGLAQQGYPISDQFQEKSDTDGKTYTVQYFERAVFEMHPENKAPYNVLLSQLGSFRYKAKYSGSTNSDAQVEIKNFDFAPGNITVAVGTKITWTNKDESAHTVADPTHAIFSSNHLRTGETFSYTTTKAGVIQYMCTLHPLMKATITVK